MSEERFYIEQRDPDGEVYDDGSADLLGAGEWPATYPTETDKVTLHFGGCDFNVTEAELAWLVEDGGPRLLAHLRSMQKPSMVGTPEGWAAVAQGKVDE